MKKSFTIFIIFSILWISTAFALIILLRFGWFYKTVFAVGVWCVVFLYYSRLEYTVEGGILKITSGILLRRERVVPLEKVLVKTKISVGGKCLFTVLTLSGGRVIVFADVP